MGRRTVVLGAGALVLAASAALAAALLAGGAAPRSDEWMCTDALGSGGGFCRSLAAPGLDGDARREVDAAKIGLLARLRGVVLEQVPMTWGDLWVERPVPASVRTLLATSLDGDLASVTGDLGRAFRVRPKIVTFASAASFETGLRDLFGYDEATARTLARGAGGALISEVRTIVINWAVLGREKPLTILRHELAHALVRDVAGWRVEVPAWFDEGLATLAQNTAAPGDPRVEEDLYVASALVAGGRASLSRLVTPRDWLAETTALDGRTYAVAAAAVDAVRDRAGAAGLARIVARTAEAGFDLAFREAVGSDPADFEREFPAILAARAPDPSLASVPAGAGTVEWRARGLRPSAVARVTVEGPGSFRLAFDVRTDQYGMYRARFGGPGTAPGTYLLRVESGGVTLTRELVLPR